MGDTVSSLRQTNRTKNNRSGNLQATNGNVEVTYTTTQTNTNCFTNTSQVNASTITDASNNVTTLTLLATQGQFKQGAEANCGGNLLIDGTGFGRFEVTSGGIDTHEVRVRLYDDIDGTTGTDGFGNGLVGETTGYYFNTGLNTGSLYSFQTTGDIRAGDVYVKATMVQGNQLWPVAATWSGTNEYNTSTTTQQVVTTTKQTPFE